MTTLVDWNLEVAHVNWASPAASFSIEEALATAREYTSDWSRSGKSFVICSLVDDKEFRISDRDAWLVEAERGHPELFRMLDYVCFESDLVTLKDEFLNQLQPRQRGRIDREIDRYRRKHGSVACSHDIAVWHMLRLGLLGSGDQIIRAIRRRRERDDLHSFYARSALSILEEEDREAEERASEILRYCTERDVTKRLELIYYA